MTEHATEHLTVSTSVSASPDACYAVVADLEHYPEWAADIKKVSITELDATGRPTLVTFRAAAFGRSTGYTLAYDYSGAPKTLAWRLTEGDITSKLDGSYVFESGANGGTEILYHLEVDLRVPIPGFIKMRAQSRIMSTALRDLKAQVERSA